MKRYILRGAVIQYDGQDESCTPKWPHLHVSSSKEKFLQSLLSAVFPCMVEANASRDDQNCGKDDVVQDTESLRLPSHNTDVLHCHGGGTARLLAGWRWRIMTSRRRTLSGQYYHELFNQYNHSHWKALCKKKDTFHNSLSCFVSSTSSSGCYEHHTD